MSWFGHSDTNKVWAEEDLGGLWMSLAQDTADGVEEVTSRKFIAHVDKCGVSRVWEGPFEFDAIVISRQPAGPLVDILHNSKRVVVDSGISANVELWWNRPPQVAELPAAELPAVKPMRWWQGWW